MPVPKKLLRTHVLDRDVKRLICAREVNAVVVGAATESHQRQIADGNGVRDYRSVIERHQRRVVIFDLMMLLPGPSP